MIVKLKELASVQMGYSFRNGIDSENSSNIAVIQMKDLNENNVVDFSNITKISFDELKENHFVQKNDLIFRSRGNTMTSAILLDDSQKAIVSAPLLRIRIINTQLINAEYLNWYINQKEAQIFLNSRIEGSVQKMISKPALEELEIEVPSIKRQVKIVELTLLEMKEQELLQYLIKKKKQHMSAKLMSYVKGE